MDTPTPSDSATPEVAPETALPSLPADAQQLTESTGTLPTGNVLEMVGDQPVIRGVTLIRAGLSANRRHYSAELLQRDGPSAFENAPAFVTNHVQSQKSLRNLVGTFQNVRFDGERLKADLHGFSTEAGLLQKALEAERALSGRTGLSIDTSARWSPRPHPDGPIQEVAQLFRTPQTSVDLVINPAAGGRLLEALPAAAPTPAPSPATPQGPPMRTKIAALTEAVLHDMQPAAVAFLIDGITEAEIQEANPTLAAAILAKAQAAPAEPVTETAAPVVNVSEAVQAEIAKIREAERCARLLETKLAGNKDLGTAVLGLLQEQFQGRIFGENELTAKIATVREQVGKERPNRPAVYAGDGVIVEAHDQQRARLEGFFRGHAVKDKTGHPVQPYRSLRWEILPAFGVDAYDPQACREALGMMAWTGDLGRASEAVSTTSFDAAWADAMYRVLMDAARNPELNTWRQWTRIISFQDLTTERKFIRTGGYGSFSTVAENGAYGSVTTPADEQVSFKPAKYGGVETISWEAVLRDDVSLISQIPGKLGTAWARTVYEVVYSTLQANSGSGAIMDYDSVALYDTSHANVVDSALSATSLLSARAKMLSQAELSSGKRLGIRPRFLLHATPDLDLTAFELVGQSLKVTSNADATLPNFFGPGGPGGGIIPIPVMYSTATTQRWELIADPSDLVGGLVGFLNGNDSPEIFVADLDTQGVKFTNDQIKIKLRGTVGFSFADHRAFVRGQNS